MARPTPPVLPAAGLLQACDDPDLFGISLTPRQRELVAEVEAGHLLHCWAVGRRSGKSLLAALIGLHFCLFRPDLARFVRRRERRYSVGVATNLRQARIFVDAARSVVEGSRLLAGLVESVSDDEVRFRNGTSLAAFPCTSRGGRGWPVMALLMDEAAHFVDGDGNAAAEPVYRSLAPSVAQFGQEARVIVASTPFGTDGWFADIFGIVEKGELPGATCARHSTVEMRPGFETAALALERLRDPESYRAEFGAEFVAAGGAFLDAARVADAVARKRELRPGEVVFPVAAVDLAFQGDSSALCIVGRDREQRERLRLVLARSWSPAPATPLSPGAVLDEIADLCLAHGVAQVYLDQFHGASAREHLQRRSLSATVVSTNAESKSAMFRDLKLRLYQGVLELYEQPDLISELARIETVTTPGAANVRIRRLGSSHGDIVTAFALACAHFRGSGEVVVASPNATDRRIPLHDPRSDRTAVARGDGRPWATPNSFAERMLRGRRW
jgi:hypothetical protein